MDRILERRTDSCWGEEIRVASLKLGHEEGAKFDARKEEQSRLNAPSQHADSKPTHQVTPGAYLDVDDTNPIAKPRVDGNSMSQLSLDQPISKLSETGDQIQKSTLKQGLGVTGTAKRRVSAGLVGAQLAVRSVAAFRGSFTDNGDTESPNAISPKPSQTNIQSISPNTSPKVVRRKSAANIIIDSDAIDVEDDFDLSPKASTDPKKLPNGPKVDSEDIASLSPKLGIRRRSSFSSPKGMESKTGKEFKSYIDDDDEEDDKYDYSIRNLSPISGARRENRAQQLGQHSPRQAPTPYFPSFVMYFQLRRIFQVGISYHCFEVEVRCCASPAHYIGPSTA